MKQFDFQKYCSPAQLYLVLAAIGLISGFLRNFRIMTLIVNAVFVVLFAWVLNFFCRKGFTTVSWVLVLLPYVLLALSYFLSLEALDKKEKEGLVEAMTDKDAEPAADATEEEIEEFCATASADNVFCQMRMTEGGTPPTTSVTS